MRDRWDRPGATRHTDTHSPAHQHPPPRRVIVTQHDEGGVALAGKPSEAHHHATRQRGRPVQYDEPECATSQQHIGAPRPVLDPRRRRTGIRSTRCRSTRTRSTRTRSTRSPNTRFPHTRSRSPWWTHDPQPLRCRQWRPVNRRQRARRIDICNPSFVQQRLSHDGPDQCRFSASPRSDHLDQPSTRQSAPRERGIQRRNPGGDSVTGNRWRSDDSGELLTERSERHGPGRKRRNPATVAAGAGNRTNTEYRTHSSAPECAGRNQTTQAELHGQPDQRNYTVNRISGTTRSTGSHDAYGIIHGTRPTSPSVFR